MTANHQTVVIDDPERGRLVQLGALAKYARPAAIGAPAPLLGQHTDEVLGVLIGQPATVKSQRSSAGSAGPAPSPLAGVTILELAYFIAGPMATSALAELGGG